MSSVSSSGGNNNNNDNEVRRTREEYKKREAELIKRHNQELRQVSEANQAELDKLREQNEAKMGSMQEGTKEAITRRDSKYQKEIEEMRKLHTQQLERLMKESDQKVQTQRKTSSAEVKHSSLGNDDRVNDLKQKYAAAMSENEKLTSGRMEEMREAQKQSIDSLRDKMNAQHEKELELQKDSSTSRIMDLSNDLRTTRSSASERLRGQEVRHMNDKMRLEASAMDEITKRDRSYNDLYDQQREAYSDGLKSISQRKLEAEEKNRENSRTAHEALKRNVENRIASRETRLENQLGDERDQSIRENTKVKRAAQNEIGQWRDQYQAKFEQLESARQETVNQANKTNADNMKVVNKQANQAISFNNRYMKNQLDSETFKAKSHIDSIEADNQVRQDYLQHEADRRVASVRDVSQNNEVALKNNFEDNLVVLKEGHSDEVSNLRLSLQEEKLKSEQQFKGQIQKQITNSEREKQEIVSKYEKQIKELNDQFIREKRLRDTREKNLTTEMMRAKESEKENLRVQYEEKQKAVTAQHNQEMHDVTRRHKEQIDNIMSNAKKT